MAKKRLNNSSWECEHGCTPSRVPCKHLERKLPAPNQGVLQKKYLKENVLAIVDELGHQPAISDERLYMALRQYGLKEYEVELIMDRYVANLSLTEISEKQGYVVNKQKIWRLLQDTTMKLQKSPEFKEWLENLAKETK